MDTGTQHIHGFLDKGTYPMPITLVAWGNDLHDGDDLVPARVADDDSLGLGGINIHLGPGSKVDLGRSSSQCDRPLRMLFGFPASCRSLQREDVGLPATGDLFRQRVIRRRQETSIQHPREFSDPVVMEMVKDARINAGPVVY